MIPDLHVDGECLLCGSPVQCYLATVPMRFECKPCGYFYVTVEAAHEINENAELKPYLSAATRQAFERRKMITLKTDNYQTFADEHRWTRLLSDLRWKRQ